MDNQCCPELSGKTWGYRYFYITITKNPFLPVCASQVIFFSRVGLKYLTCYKHSSMKCPYLLCFQWVKQKTVCSSDLNVTEILLPCLSLFIHFLATSCGTPCWNPFGLPECICFSWQQGAENVPLRFWWLQLLQIFWLHIHNVTLLFHHLTQGLSWIEIWWLQRPFCHLEQVWPFYSDHLDEWDIFNQRVAAVNIFFFGPLAGLEISRLTPTILLIHLYIPFRHFVCRTGLHWPCLHA